jgi:hypothetical protein
MFTEYIEAALERAVYKTIDDETRSLFQCPSFRGPGLRAKLLKRPAKSLSRLLKAGSL